MTEDYAETEREASRDSWLSYLLPLALILGLVLLLSLNVGGSGEEAAPINPLESWVRLLVGYLATGAEIAAALVISVAVLHAIGAYLRQWLVRRTEHLDSTESIRLRLGRVLALGLEFSIASDILRTAVAPTRQEILNLAAIVLLRTLLNYFLEREIHRVERRRTREVSE